ncbi:Mus7/MMS22 family-domain-containing protein [Microdochium bolleyi]|uniref:Mus7/MMS22 family-domain-containing protein n=1 Tax=Microdochium bolleyi TaxID=196109 RepID=A0A136IXA9_9PEZI|nr:Mus7/MMS22 family-domain-containing protein [Microdochium bolleyi]
MATWKELGEVPDSDDEDTLDTDDSQPSLHLDEIQLPVINRLPAQRQESPPDRNGPDDIWDVPTSLSQERSALQRHGQIEEPGISTPFSQDPIDIPSSPLSELAGYDFEELARSFEPDIAEGPIVPLPPSQPLDVQAASRDVGVPTPSTTSTPQSDRIDPTQTFDRGYRSLRPRKPIQEHPYLLENAQYSKLFKSHGVRPMRVTAEEQYVQEQEKDSQEQDYEEDSQLTVQNGVSNQLEESQPADLYDSLGDLDDLALSPLETALQSPAERSPMRDPPSSSVQDDDDDEELPDIADIGKWVPRKKAKHHVHSTPQNLSKRQGLRLPGSTKSPRKLASSLRPLGVFDIPPSPPDTSPALQNLTPMARLGTLRRDQGLTPRASSIINSPRPESPEILRSNNFIVDLSKSATNSEVPDDDGSSSSSDSEPNADVVEAEGKRIRGVLPASWLRLDQKQIRGPANQRMLIQRSPGKSPRRGVAQRRITTSTAPIDSGIFFDDSDESNDETTLRTHDSILQHKQNVQDTRGKQDLAMFEDDTGSVVEDDQIDLMLPGSKRRSRTDHDASHRKKMKKGRASIREESGRPMKQQKISAQITRTKSMKKSSGSQIKRPGVTEDHKPTQKSRRRTTPTKSAPRLSVLDVIEPNAPSFLRIAARTARQRTDKGRASPSQKIISLGIRRDNIDASKALSSWRNGAIQPRTSVTALKPKRRSATQALHSVSQHVVQPSGQSQSTHKPKTLSQACFSEPRRQLQLTHSDHFPHIPKQMPNAPPPYKPSREGQSASKSNGVGVRPAMLETLDNGRGRQAFDSRKRALDALFRRSRKNTPSLASQLEITLDKEATAQHLIWESVSSSGSPVAQRRSVNRTRKRVQPKWVDVSAPQYSRANDPLPATSTPAAPVQGLDTCAGGKLLGLGAFGTHYTQHFEIFPLDPGAYFHQDTLVGSGRLARALDLQHESRGSKPAGTFVLGEKVLHWIVWSSQVSSEFGILFDWVLDEITPQGEAPYSLQPIAAQGLLFALDFIQQTLELSTSDVQQAFFARFCDVLLAFSTRLETLLPLIDSHSSMLVDILSTTLLLLSHALCLTRKLNLITDQHKLESVLAKLSKLCVTLLLRNDLSEVSHIYDKLQALSFREKGIRGEHSAVVCWVCLMHVLQHARIPRMGFWDVVGSVMVGPDLQSSFDSVHFEKIWQNVFTLLPLGEFGNDGVLVSGNRRSAPLEGWSIPQKLLNRVFAIYKTNSQQAPSFNDYCRALLGRCHYLAEQWSWRKSNAIIGLTFDFFASQGLAHLRHEEAYKSPDFLEDLATAPSLSVTADDRCFHIFLKLVAMTIKSLTGASLVKDIRNLVARIMPNHDRQFNKEVDMQQRDLAALRNHHDLLCTLFWAAPVELRPSAQMVERLVQPESSHKEALLVNLKAWGQLSRFIVSQNADLTTYRPFASWIRNITQQLLQQYRSAESDVQHQFVSMSNEASKSVSQDLMDIVISTNKKAALEALGSAMTTVLTTMQHVPQLNLATLVLNNYPLELVFTELQSSAADSGWRCLQLGLEIVDSYLSMITRFAPHPGADPDPGGQWHIEEALEFLERVVMKYFFRTARDLLHQHITQTASSSQLNCFEQMTLVGGRLAARVAQANLAPVNNVFAAGRYAVFPNPGESHDNVSRKYLSLFIATLVLNGATDFTTLKPPKSMLGILLCEIVKPLKFLKYEHRLAAALQSAGSACLQKVTIPNDSAPGYSSNRDLFSSITKNMRRSLQVAEQSDRAALRTEFSNIMKSVMEQLKADLRLMTSDPKDQHAYINFVRLIISLMRAQDFCPIDQFFYQISPEYTPSSQDPRLQTAGIISYGLKLEDDDPRAAPGLFYLLLTNFKMALANSRLAEERTILEKGMSHPHITTFMLGRMIPALVATAGHAAEAWVLLETYARALCDHVSAPAIHRSFEHDQMPAALNLMCSALTALQKMAAVDIDLLGGEHLYSLTLIFMALNTMGPSVMVYFMVVDHEIGIESDEPSKMRSAVASITSFVQPAIAYLEKLIERPGSDAADTDEETLVIVPGFLFEGVETHDFTPHLEGASQVADFTRHVLDDISRHWVMTGTTITVQGPTRPQGLTNTQSGRGVEVPGWRRLDLICGLLEQLRLWATTFGHSTPAKPSEQEQFWGWDL